MEQIATMDQQLLRNDGLKTFIPEVGTKTNSSAKDRSEGDKPFSLE